MGKQRFPLPDGPASAWNAAQTGFRHRSKLNEPVQLQALPPRHFYQARRDAIQANARDGVSGNVFLEQVLPEAVL
eukprot:9182119-Pyramimonas_sp.AAC.1